MPVHDYAIVGGGIVGLSTGMALTQRRPHARIVVLEKENRLAAHQTGHNSGVIHSGIYYAPGSLKAKLAREGNQSMVEFCQTHGIKHDVCGKVIVATKPEELPRLKQLHQRGLANGLKVTEIGKEALNELEPHAAGIAALHVPSTGIVDYRSVAETFARIIEQHGGVIHSGARVETLSEHGDEVVIETANGTFQARHLINCAGLQSDRVAALSGVHTRVRIVPFRGEYYELKPEKRGLVKNLIYPVPNPKFPFLGVHFTRMIGGEIHAGPNAVLSLKREGYRKSDIDFRDVMDIITYPAFWKFSMKNLGEGIKEMVRSASKTAFVRSLQKLIPDIQADDLMPGGAGVRAQALMDTGKLMDDFLIVRGPKSTHVCNAPSPAATASIEIGKTIAEQIAG
jgi:L-2-hydroxyglutarate oxidase